MSQTFAELGLNPEMTAGLDALGFEQPTKIQSAVIPQLLAGRDVVAEAPPGSGKSFAFILPILQTLDPDIEGVQVVVVAGSGDDATRLANLFQDICHRPDIRIVPLRGGQPLAREIERLTETTTIVVGTAARVSEHVERESFALDQVQFVVLDSAELLLSKKRQPLIEQLLDRMPASRQTAIFASQLNNQVQNLADQHLFEPVVIKRDTSAAAMPLIKHRYQIVKEIEKPSSLARLLDSENIDRAIIYVGLSTETVEVARMLQAQGYPVGRLHMGSKASEKNSLVRNWREGNINFLVLTDAAAEELVIDSPYGISYDIATDADNYAARTRLVVENGTFFSLVTARERRLLSEIETHLGQRIKAVLPPTHATAVAKRTETFKQRLRDIIKTRNLEVYMLLLNDLAEEGFDWSELAAAAVSLVQYTQSDAIFTRRSDKRSSGAPSRYRDSGRDRSRSRDEDREVESGYVRLIMDAGYDIGVRPKDIVGAIANEANIPGRAVGNIDIRDRFTYVEVQEDYTDRVLTRVPSTRLRGRVVTFRRV
ncbi:MAG TPA: DEAD/DEAH box helicase [Caldilineae bacterium]|nr:DEAD/DEAH box helicase [Caldilineae bacterium]